MTGWLRSNLLRVFALLIGLTGLMAVGLVAFGAAAPPPPLDERARGVALGTVGYGDLPPLSQYSSAGGSPMNVRVYKSEGAKASLILIHGATGSSRTVHGLARYLSEWGAARVYALDVRGHGATSPRGDLERAGQLDVDLGELIAAVRRERPGEKTLVAAHGLGAGFVVRYAGLPKSPYPAADGYLLLAPLLEREAAVNRPGSDPAWGRLSVARAVGLAALDNVKVRFFQDLPVQAWNVATDSAEGERTAAYSFRLWKQFRAGEDFRRDLKGIKPPLTVMVGSHDDYLIAENFGPAIRFGKPDGEVIALDGVSHYGILVQPQALEAIAAWVRR